MSKFGNFAVTTLGILFCLCIAAVLVGIVGGWGMNIIQLFSCDFTEINNKEVLKIVGIIFIPIGAVMGWIG